jgi:hypothetical protein
MFRLQRLSERVTADRSRYVLKAIAVKVAAAQTSAAEVAREVDTEALRDKIERGLVVATPEETFEQLWQQLRVDLEAL